MRSVRNQPVSTPIVSSTAGPPDHTCLTPAGPGRRLRVTSEKTSARFCCGAAGDLSQLYAHGNGQQRHGNLLRPAQWAPLSMAEIGFTDDRRVGNAQFEIKR